MAAIKLLNLVAVISLALFASSFNAPVNALAAGHQHSHLNRQIAHEGVARRTNKRSTKRCKPKSSSVSKTSEPTSATPTSPALVTIKTSSPAPAPEKTSKPSPAPAPSPTPAPAPAPAPAPPASSGGNSGKVLGIAWNGGNAPSLGLLAKGNADVMYDWSVWKSTNTYGLNFVPQLWGANKIQEFQANFPKGSNHVLGFNEPDLGSQSNLSPGDAANIFRSNVTPKKSQGATLISPAPTGSQGGVEWLQQFMSACSDCGVDIIAIHVYETTPEKVISFATDVHNKFGKNIWITEFACQNFGGGSQCSMDDAWNFYKTIMKWAVNTPWVEKVFPFAFLEDMGNVSQVNQALRGGQLTDLGNYLIYGNFNE